jgi:hypothetical protein
MGHQIRNTNPSSHRGKGPTPETVGVIEVNKNKVMVPDKTKKHAGEGRQ